MKETHAKAKVCREVAAIVLIVIIISRTRMTIVKAVVALADPSASWKTCING